jgi:hypothetical protein
VKPIEIPENSKLKLKCSLKEPIKDLNQVKWYKNNKPITANEKNIRINNSNDCFELEIDNCSPARDNGTYKIEIQDADGNKLIDEISLLVLEDKLKLSPLVVEGDDIREGGKVTLVTKASKLPKSVQWLKDGKPIDVKDKRLTPNSDEKEFQLSLSIDNLQLTDTAVYTIRADDVESSYKLIIKELPLTFVQELTYSLTEPQDKVNGTECIKLWCTTNKSLDLNDSKYVVKWFKDGNPVKIEATALVTSKPAQKPAAKSNAKFLLKYELDNQDEKKTHILWVYNIDKAADSGTYEIKIYLKEKEKLLLESKTEIKLGEKQKEEIEEKKEKVESKEEKQAQQAQEEKAIEPEEPKEKKEEKEEPVSEDEKEEKKKEDDAAVELVGVLSASNPKPVEGENVSVTATLSKPIDDKKYKLVWYFNGQLVDKTKKQPRFSLGSKSDIESLFEIKPLKAADEGGLVEVAIIKLDNNKELQRLSLRFDKPLKLLSELKTTKPQYVEEGVAEMSCEVNKIPEKIVLAKNPKEPVELITITPNTSLEKQIIDENDKYKIELKKTKDDSYKLTIAISDLVPKEDAAKYWLSFNEDELSSNECQLNIQPVELKFKGDITTPNKNPLDSIEHIQINFSLNKKVPVEDLLSDLQVVLKRPLKKEEVLPVSSYDLVLDEEKPETTAKSVVSYKIVMKLPASVDTDTGIYNLKLNSSKDKSPNSLNIEVLSRNLFVMEMPEKLELFEGEPLKLQVKCNQQIINYYWLKDDEKLSYREDQKNKVEKLTFMFSISAAKLADSGAYEFVCDDFKERTQNAQLIKTRSKCDVLVKPKQERQIKSLNDLGTIRLKEGDTLVLPVKFDKRVPEEDIGVYLNGNEFVPEEHGNEVSIKYNPDLNTYVVQIENVQPGRDEGVFKITSPNTESECKVIIEEKPLKFVTEIENFKIKVLPPIFYERAASNEALLSGYPRTATYECQLSKYYTDIVWSVNDKPVESERFKVKLIIIIIYL